RLLQLVHCLLQQECLLPLARCPRHLPLVLERRLLPALPLTLQQVFRQRRARLQLQVPRQELPLPRLPVVVPLVRRVPAAPSTSAQTQNTKRREPGPREVSSEIGSLTAPRSVVQVAVETHIIHPEVGPARPPGETHDGS